MATYQFSALADGQTISFNPNTDVLNFDDPYWQGFKISAVSEGANLRVTAPVIPTGPSPIDETKSVLLLNVSAFQVTTVNVTFEDGSRLIHGDNSTALNDNAANTLTGGSGDDKLVGFGGADTMNGGLGHDHYHVTTGDVIVDSGGIDTVHSDVSWSLGASSNVENLVLTGTAAITANGNNLNNTIVGNDASNSSINGRAGDDFMYGMGGNDTFDMSTGGTSSYGNDFISGGSGSDTVDFGANARSAISVNLNIGTLSGGGDGGAGSAELTSIENAVGGNFNDSMMGGYEANFFFGGAGNDTLDGFAGNDRLQGGTGSDVYVANFYGSASADQLLDFASGADKLHLDAAYMGQLGADGNFAAGDARFWASASGAAHDADDRVLYNTTTRSVYYDADGSGSGTAELLFTLQAGAALAATDVVVINGIPPGQTINGTAGDDYLTGTFGDDTINGLGGNDTLDGQGGSDSLNGGDGDDWVVAGRNEFTPVGGDTLIGGNGNDTLYGAYFSFNNDPTADRLDGGLGDDQYAIDHQNDVLVDAGGIDTVIAKDMDWTLGAGFENLRINNDFGEGRQTGIGNSLNNEMWLMWGGGRLEGLGGNDTLHSGNLTSDLFGGDGDDILFGHHFGIADGGAGNDIITDGIDARGGDGDDLLSGQSSFEGRSDGGAGNDTLHGAFEVTGGAGADHFVLATGGGTITDFTSGADRGQLNGTQLFGTGPSGDFAAGDQRFWASSSGAAHDASDRVIYNTTTGELFYDEDGTGSAAAELLATLQGAPTVAATDFYVVNGSGGGEGEEINGTAGNDSLVGTAGDDTINGLGGDDTLAGGDGSDLLNGGDGNDELGTGGESRGPDTLVGGAGNDTLDGTAIHWMFATVDVLDGGVGDDEFHVDFPGDELLDAGGIDSVSAYDMNWTLANGFENLFLQNQVSEGAVLGVGNAADNEMSSSWGAHLQGLGGDDTLSGGFNSDTLDGGAGNDVLSGDGADANTYVFSAAAGAANADEVTEFYSGIDSLHLDGSVMAQLGVSGNFDADDARFHAAAGATGGHDADDRVVFDTATRKLYYDADGSGAGAGLLVATLLQASANVVATDIWVDNGTPGQHVEGSFGNDSLVGTAGDDTMEGFSGHDTMQGLGGHDYIAADEHDDLLEGGAGRDTLNGGSGNDTANGGAGSDIIQEGDGIDIIVFDAAPGAANVDRIWGFQSGSDTLSFDLDVFAALGAGGRFTANDARFHASTNAVAHDTDDRIIHSLNNGDLWYDADGTGAGAAVLIGNLRVSEHGTESILAPTDIFVDDGSGGGGGQVINGTAGNDSLTGTTGDDTINGLGGNDTIDGVNGADVLDGGAGDDSIVGGHHDPQSDPADVYIGGDGNDTLDGDSAGFSDPDLNVETMDGGLGNDLYIVDNEGDVLSDAGGTDTVRATNINWTLGAGFENLQMANGEAETLMRGTGNALNNVLDGESFGWGVRLEGLGGNDTLLGSSRADTLVGGDGSDSLLGGSHNDVLDGGAGVDTMDGGFGDDVYVVTAGDVVFDGGDGFDLVESSISWALGNSGVERLTLTGTAATTANGNNVENVLTGNDASNGSINGRAGNDTMLGMGGNDTFDMSTGGTSTYGNDVIDGGGGTDTVDFGSNARTAVNVNLAAGTMSGGGDGGTGSATLTSIENAVGGNFNDVLSGNAAANFFFGGNGNDTLTGAGGNDRLQGGAGNDAFVFNTAPATGNNDVVVDFATGVDKLQMENSVMTAIGATGNFAAGDARFWAAAGATSGHDANDRIVYNTSNGNLYYDADGSGSGAAQLIATLQGQAALGATDIAVI